MRSAQLLLLTVVLTPGFLTGQPAGKKSVEYLNQETPGLTPVIFAPELVSMKDHYEFGSVFSNNGKEFYYAVNVGPVAEIRYMIRQGDTWSAPQKLLSSTVYSHNDPFLAPDDQRLFFISDRPLNGTGDKKDYDIWYIQRNGSTWSEPRNAGKAINTEHNEYYVSFSKTGSLYFSSNGRTNAGSNNYDIYEAKASNGGFQEATRLNDQVNTPAYEADVFVAPDESYLIFCADRPEGKGKGDLYISFKSKDGSWAKAKNMGPVLNTSGNELCPYVTKNGKYFFYTSNREIYWVSTKVFDEFK